MPSPQASLQLIVFGERNRTDLPNVFKEVSQAGFAAIECGNLFETVGETETRRLLDLYGLRISAVHLGYGEYEKPDRVAMHVAFCKAMGVNNLLCSGVSDSKCVEGYRSSSRLFNEVGARLHDQGLRFHYHNHAWEFNDLGGVNGMDIIAADTDPSLVGFNIDVFWVMVGGLDPAAFIRRHRERAGYFHFKDGRVTPDGKPVFLELGRGAVDLRSAMAAALEVDAEWIVAEQDRTELPHLEAVTISRQFMRTELGLS